MANWCSNFIEITASPEGNPMKKWFREHTEKSYDEGQLPELKVEEDERPYTCFLFNIQADSEVIVTETKWAPPIEEMVAMGNLFQISWTMDHQELGCGVYGRASYDHKTQELTDTYLDNELTDLVQEDEDRGVYILEGKEYECREEAYDVLLNRV